MNGEPYTGPLLKPSRLDTDVRKYQRRQERKAAREAVERSERDRFSTLRKACYVRDGGKCRAYGVALKLVSDNPLDRCECHHKVYRSAGGADEMWNLITLSPQAHRDEHEHRLVISGDPNGTLTFVKRDLETGKTLQMWTSEVGR